MFGPPLSAGLPHLPVLSPTGMSPLPSPGIYGGYGPLSLTPAPTTVFHAPAPALYGPYPLYGQNGKVIDGPHQSHTLQGRNMQKRGSDGEGVKNPAPSLPLLLIELQ